MRGGRARAELSQKGRTLYSWSGQIGCRVCTGDKAGGEGPGHVVEYLPLDAVQNDVPAGGEVPGDIQAADQLAVIAVGLHPFVDQHTAEGSVGGQFAAEGVVRPLRQRDQPLFFEAAGVLAVPAIGVIGVDGMPELGRVQTDLKGQSFDGVRHAQLGLARSKRFLKTSGRSQ